eukprot:scaffold385_cov305-Pinguiococcus_pyrenoidosus.AAC.8
MRFAARGRRTSENIAVVHRPVDVLEGRVTGQHLEEEAAHGPEVHGVVVALVEDELRRDVLRRAAHGERPGVVDLLPVGQLLDPGHSLGEAEVDEHQIALVVHHEVLGLEVPVGHAVEVDVAEDLADVGGVEGGSRHRQAGPVPHEARGVLVDEAPELHVGQRVGEEVQVVLVLEGGVQLQDEVVVQALEDAGLVEDVLHLLALHRLRLGDGLEGEVHAVLLSLDQLRQRHDAEAALTQHAQIPQVGQHQLARHFGLLVAGHGGRFVPRVLLLETAREQRLEFPHVLHDGLGGDPRQRHRRGGGEGRRRVREQRLIGHGAPGPDGLFPSKGAHHDDGLSDQGASLERLRGEVCVAHEVVQLGVVAGRRGGLSQLGVVRAKQDGLTSHMGLRRDLDDQLVVEVVLVHVGFRDSHPHDAALQQEQAVGLLALGQDDVSLGALHALHQRGDLGDVVRGHPLHHAGVLEPGGALDQRMRRRSRLEAEEHPAREAVHRGRLSREHGGGAALAHENGQLAQQGARLQGGHVHAADLHFQLAGYHDEHVAGLVALAHQDVSGAQLGLLQVQQQRVHVRHQLAVREVEHLQRRLQRAPVRRRQLLASLRPGRRGLLVQELVVLLLVGVLRAPPEHLALPPVARMRGTARLRRVLRRRERGHLRAPADVGHVRAHFFLSEADGVLMSSALFQRQRLSVPLARPAGGVLRLHESVEDGGVVLAGRALLSQVLALVLQHRAAGAHAVRRLPTHATGGFKLHRRIGATGVETVVAPENPEKRSGNVEAPGRAIAAGTRALQRTARRIAARNGR